MRLKKRHDGISSHPEFISGSHEMLDQVQHDNSIISILKEKYIKNIAFNSKLVVPGCAFFITQYIEEYLLEAINKGASIIVYDKKLNNLPKNVESIVVGDVRDALGEAAAYLYPNKPKYIVAVTGTSGKTSIVDYFRQLGGLSGEKIASFGTMGMKCSDKKIEEELKQYELDINTPDVITVHKVLDHLAKAGVDYVAFEASSHGIHQKRIAGVKLSVAAFVNFSQDHLDYHGNMDEYKEVKLTLFTHYLKPNGTAIIYEDLLKDNVIESRLKSLGNRLLSVGKSGDLQLLNLKSDVDGLDIEFTYKNQTYNIKTDLVGSFQAINILIALAMLDECGINLETTTPLALRVKSVKGRLERATNAGDEYHIFVDHAHKPEALRMSLEELRKFTSGRLIVVFGCGGNRDTTKRKIMGEIAEELADIVVVTDDNPRKEDPAFIRKQIMEGAPHAREVSPRADAIEYAISNMKKGDILLVAGKGHETYQIIGEEKIPFDDTEEVRKYIT